MDEVRERLAAARLYLCVGRRPDLAGFAEAVSTAGVDIVQFRHKQVAADGTPDLAEWREEVAAHAQLRQGVAGRCLVAVNDRADLAAVLAAPVLHLGQRDIPPALARRFVGADAVIGLSAHTPEEVERAAADPEVDYFCAGPVWPTPTKAGRPAAGLELLGRAAAVAGGKPWFAIGGIDRDRIDEVIEAGAERVVVVRAITEAADPAAAARELRGRLPG